MHSHQPQPTTTSPDIQSAPLMRMPTVIRWTGLARSTIYRLIAQQKFPAPVVLASRAVGWRRAAPGAGVLTAPPRRLCHSADHLA